MKAKQALNNTAQPGQRKSTRPAVKSKLTFTRPSALSSREPMSSTNRNKGQFNFNEKVVDGEQYPENKTHRDKKGGLFFSKQGLELARKPLFDLGEEELARGRMEGIDDTLADASE